MNAFEQFTCHQQGILLKDDGTTLIYEMIRYLHENGKIMIINWSYTFKQFKKFVIIKKLADFD